MRGSSRCRRTAPVTVALLKGCPAYFAFVVRVAIVAVAGFSPTYVASGFSRTSDVASGFSRTSDVASGFSRTSAAEAADLRLIQAVKNRDADAVRALLKERVDVTAPPPDRPPALPSPAHPHARPIP